ncbi:hypothetical protein [Pseudomonas cichorii]|uniref:hypothetical protein n=1 Tax=Pseudomonas cichorii TaxID=36746 RepID=UPI001F2D99B9|nr:hypothetical protein [Pseudomonas cichorii]
MELILPSAGAVLSVLRFVVFHKFEEYVVPMTPFALNPPAAAKALPPSVASASAAAHPRIPFLFIFNFLLIHELAFRCEANCHYWRLAGALYRLVFIETRQLVKKTILRMMIFSSTLRAVLVCVFEWVLEGDCGGSGMKMPCFLNFIDFFIVSYAM